MMNVDPSGGDVGSNDESPRWANDAPEGREGASPSPAIPPTETLRDTPTPDLMTGLPRRIGHYHIERVIGSGGMGTVYEATQEKPRRTVALKLMKHGIASRSALRRFEYESQILGRLRHPGIAQVYEAGTHREDGDTVPYFAMEYIHTAKPITAYARDKKLGTRKRLELFLQVCGAVHHGHQKGIIHRDLKPSNLLVDAHGQVKIIDFGVAKSTDSDMAVTTLQTDVGQLVGTLQYMSPEQCEADPHNIDTRSDVYALGAVFYELLCDRRPYDVTRKAMHEATRIIREEQPTKLSTLNKTLRGDVETIALKALEKDPERRYESTMAMAADVERYLKHQPIVARPPSVLYRFRKFVRRRRIALAVAAALLMTSGTAVYFQMQVRRARWAVGRAAEYAREAKKLTLKVPEIHTWVLEGNDERASRICAQALELDPNNPLALRTQGFLRLARGDFRGALEAYNQGLQTLENVRMLPEDFHNRGRLRRIFGDYRLALADHERAIALAPKQAMPYQGRGITRWLAGDVDGAVEDLTRAATLQPPWAVQMNQWIWEILMLRGNPGDREKAEEALRAAERAATDPFEVRMLGVCR
ncbi:MAG: protein kinase, partial [Phycisphaerales bacterium]